MIMLGGHLCNRWLESPSSHVARPRTAGRCQPRRCTGPRCSANPLLAALDASDKVYILSAKHGIISCGETIEPYDVTLKTMRKDERLAWGGRVGPQLDMVLKRRDTAAFYCGEEYLAPLRPHLAARHINFDMPLLSLPLGGRLQELARRNDEAGLRRDLAHFRQLLRHLWIAQGGGRRLDEANGRLPWPRRGVYFFLEADHGISGGRMPRVVRIGTHAVSRDSRTSLWDRLSTHRGTSTGSGSHRSSIFRLHVGKAWMRRHPTDEWPDSWAEGMSAPREIRDSEEKLEREVSRSIGSLRVIWLDIPDEAGPQSERAFLERNAIGVISRAGPAARYVSDRPGWDATAQTGRLRHRASGTSIMYSPSLSRRFLMLWRERSRERSDMTLRLPQAHAMQ